MKRLHVGTESLDGTKNEHKTGRNNMKKLLLMICLVGSLFAGWEEPWLEGINACHEKKWDLALEKFDEALASKDIGDNAARVLIDKSRVFLYNDQNELALKYCELGLEKNTLEGDDKLRAVVTKGSALSRLGRIDESVQMVQEVKELINFPKLEIYENYVIMRNFPDCPCALQLAKKIMLAYFCESEQDITYTCGILKCLITKKPCKEDKCPAPKLDTSKLQGRIKTPQALTECEYYCNRVYQAGINFCNHKFKNFGCNSFCQATCETLLTGCHWCCKGNGFYQNCIKPFEDIVGAMGGVCDPAWD